MDDAGQITDFIEKPEHFVSDLAIIGIYYFQDGETLHKELQYLIDNDLKEKGEYQITNALENMKQKGLKFAPGKVIEWLDCGNKNNTVYTHARWLESKSGENLIDDSLINRNALVIEPCFIGKGVTIVNSVIGPHVSLADGCTIENSIVRNSIVQKNTRIQNSVIGNSMIGSFVEIKNQMLDLSVGDYSVSSTGN
jgi:glucose-1-phosphate thymidylyltransferase